MKKLKVPERKQVAEAPKKKAHNLSQFLLALDLENAVFDTDPVLELAKRLKVVISQLEGGCVSASVTDSKGNTIGEWEITHQEEGE